MNHQITTTDLFEIIGRQRVEIELITRQLEQMQALAQREQNRANEAQATAKKLYYQQNGVEKAKDKQIPT